MPRFAFAYAAILVVLVVFSFPRHTGDGYDYVSMAYNLSHGRPPALSESDLTEVRDYFARWRSGYESEPTLFIRPQLRGAGGRYELQHFWFYPALAAPVLLVTDALGLHPNYAFTVVNLCLLLAAATVVGRRLHWTLTTLLFIGPILWWVDKAQVEVFIFALLALAMAWIRDRPWWSLVCLGAAATANPVIAGAVPIAAVACLLARPALLRSRAFWAGAAGGVVLAALYPVYYLVQLGRLSPVLNTRQVVPTLVELKVPLADLNYGLLFNFPIFPLAVLAVAVLVFARDRRGLLESYVVAALCMASLFLVGVSETTLYAHGGTPSISRYATWFIPLAIPLLMYAQASGHLQRRWLVPVAVLAAVWGVAMFNPRRDEGGGLRPTPVASFVWKHWPGLDNPLAQIFAVRESHQFGLQPAATGSCSKVLVVNDQWPGRCRIGDIPARCRRTACYANRSGTSYSFVAAPLAGGSEPGIASAGPNAPPPQFPPDGVRLKTGGAGGAFELSPTELRSPAGRVAIESGVVSGYVDGSEDLGTTATFSGWAAGARDHRPATAILLFSDGRFVGRSALTVPRPDVATSLGARDDRFGYRFWLPRELIDGQRPHIEIVAVAGKVASLLPFGCSGTGPHDFACADR